MDSGVASTNEVSLHVGRHGHGVETRKVTEMRDKPPGASQPTLESWAPCMSLLNGSLAPAPSTVPRPPRPDPCSLAAQALGVPEVQVAEPILTLSGATALEGDFASTFAAFSAVGVPINLVALYDDIGGAYQWATQLPVQVRRWKQTLNPVVACMP